MASIGNPAGKDPRRLPGYPFGIGPILNWYDKGNPSDVPGSCEPCEDVAETSVPFTPDPGTPTESRATNGSSATASGGATAGVRRGAAMLGLLRRVGASLPIFAAPEGCAGSGVCTAWANVDGSLATQVSAAATCEPFGVPICLTLNSAGPATPTQVGPWVSSAEARFYPGLTTLRTPIGTKITYSGSPNPGEYYTTPAGVQNRLQLKSNGDYEETQPNGLKRTYNSSGLLTSWVANAGTWTVTRGSGDRVDYIIDPAGRRTTFSYDATSGKLSKITDSGGRETLFSFNSNDLETVISPEGCETSFTYVADNGTRRIETWTTPSGYKTTFQYDTDGRVKKVQRPDGTTTITYDTDTMQIQDARGYVTTYVQYTSGEVKAVINAKNERITYTWDNKWPKTVQDGRGNVYTFTYQSLTADANIVRVKSIQLPAGGIVTYAMENDNLRTVKDERGYVTTLNWSSGRLSSVQNAKGNLTTYGYTTQYKQLQTIKNPLGKTWTMSYDGTGRKTEDRDPLGNRTTYTYDAAGCLSTVKNPLGKVTTYVFDDMNRITSVKDPNGDTTSYSYEPGSCLLETVTDALGRVTSHTYDTNGRLQTVINALGERTSYSYDANGNLTEVWNAANERTTNTYDALNRLETVKNPLGKVTSYTYDKSGNLETTKNPLGQVSTTQYDANNRLQAEVNPLGQRTSYGYDLSGNRETVKNPLGFVTSTTYDEQGMVKEVIDPLGKRTSFTYDAAARQETVKDAEGKVTTYSYDDAGRLTSTTDARGKVTTNIYDVAGQLETVQDAEGKVTSYTYDGVGRLRTVEDPLGRVTTYSYDGVGNQTVVTNPLGQRTSTTYDDLNRVKDVENSLGFRTSYTYDPAGRQKTLKNPLGKVTTQHYDAAGQLQAVEDANGKRTSYTYDDAGRQETVKDAEGKITSYMYDAAGRVETIKDAKGNVRSFTYDAAGQVTKETDPLGRIVTYGYDDAGRLKTRKDARGITTTYGYDGTGRVTLRHYQNDGRVTIQYNEVGNVKNIEDGIGTWTLTYDNVNRVKTVADPAGKTITYTYDGAGQRTVMAAPTGGLFSYSHYNDGSPKTIQNPEGDRTTLTYDDAGRVRKKELGNGTIASFSYDAANQVKVVANLTSAGGMISRYTYTYDAVGNRTKVDEGGSNVVDWSYYDTYRLKNEKRSGANAFNTTFTYDAVGNRTVQQKDGALTTYSYDAANQLTTSVDSTGTTNYSYDQAGNLEVITAPGGSKTTYMWDDENRNKKLQLADGTVVTMSYRHDGLRYKKEVGATTTKFIYDGQNYLAETDGADTLNKVITNEPEGYGNLVSQRILQAGTWTPAYHHFDALGSTRNITNVSQAVANTYTYNAWGEVLSPSEAIPNLFRWIGQLGYYFDDENDTYYVRARHYDPVRGRWLSADPIGYLVGPKNTHNLYEYVNGMPLVLGDPNGQFAWWPLLLLIPLLEGCRRGAAPKRATCCCAISITGFTSANIDRFTGPMFVQGNSYSFDVNVTYINPGTALPGDCLFKWWEWVDNLPAFGAGGMKPNKWYEQIERRPDSNTFKDLMRHRDDYRAGKFNTAGAIDSISFSDSPKYSNKAPRRRIDRTLWIGVKVENAPGCPCANAAPVTLILKQKLDQVYPSKLTQESAFPPRQPGPPPGW